MNLKICKQWLAHSSKQRNSIEMVEFISGIAVVYTCSIRNNNFVSFHTFEIVSTNHILRYRCRPCIVLRTLEHAYVHTEKSCQYIMPPQFNGNVVHCPFKLNTLFWVWVYGAYKHFNFIERKCCLSMRWMWLLLLLTVWINQNRIEEKRASRQFVSRFVHNFNHCYTRQREV